MRLMRLYGLRESGPPANWPWTADQLRGSEEQAERMLRDAVAHGRMVPAPRTVFGSGDNQSAETNMIWDMGDSFIGVNVHDGWPLVWTGPKTGSRADFDAGNPNTPASNFSSETELDPWSDEMDD